MSRIGKAPILVSDKVEVTLTAETIKVKWPLWELSFNYSQDVEIKKEENSLVLSPKNETFAAIWWTTRAVINNMMVWVTEGFKKSLEINWVGYKFEVSGNAVILSIGFSHKVEIKIPAWLKAEMDEKAKNIIHISGIDKQLVWEFTAKLRAKKKPEPYKGKWIKYVGEQIIRKAGKSGKK